ncbi:MAG: branched-chain amino acid ABC transporter permease [Nitrososphaerales archaeon]
MNAVAVARNMLGRSNQRVGWGGIGLLGAFFVLAPAFVGSYRVSLLAQALAFSTFALSLDLLWGGASIFSFGHAAFFGMGAYSLGLVERTGVLGAGWVGLLASIVLPGVLAMLIGYFCFYARISGTYFAIITLAVSLILSETASSWSSFTGGDNGLYPVALPLSLSSDDQLYYVALAVLVVAFVVALYLTRSGFGLAMEAMGANENRAEALGYDTARVKLILFAISGAMAGFAGAIYAPMVGSANPNLLGVTLSTEVIIWVALGGRGTLVGPVIGAVAISFVSDYLSGTFAEAWILILGGLLLAVVLFRPAGILGSARVRRFIRAR